MACSCPTPARDPARYRIPSRIIMVLPLISFAHEHGPSVLKNVHTPSGQHGRERVQARHPVRSTRAIGSQGTGAGYVRSGNATKKLEPSPSTEVNHTRPPAFSTMRFTMGRPRPMPLVLVVNFGTNT